MPFKQSAPPTDFEIIYEDEPIQTTAGSRLLDVLLEAGMDHRHVCGGNGFCTSCRIEVLDGAEGLSPVSRLERERLGAEAGRLRLACQTFVSGPSRIRVPAPVSSRFSPYED